MGEAKRVRDTLRYPWQSASGLLYDGQTMAPLGHGAAVLAKGGTEIGDRGADIISLS